MPQLLAVKKHLTIEELHERFRTSKDVVEKVRWQIIWLRAQGRGTNEVAALCGFKRDWIHQLVRSYNEQGPEALRNGKLGKGKAKMMTNQQIEELRVAVHTSQAPGGGIWTGPKVALWMSEKLGRPVSPQVAWEYLQHIGFSKQVPRPRHVQADPRVQEDWKKNSAAV